MDDKYYVDEGGNVCRRQDNYLDDVVIYGDLESLQTAHDICVVLNAGINENWDHVEAALEALVPLVSKQLPTAWLENHPEHKEPPRCEECEKQILINDDGTANHVFEDGVVIDKKADSNHRPVC